MPTNSTYDAMLNSMSVSKKRLSEDDLPQESPSGVGHHPGEVHAAAPHLTRGVRSPKAGHTVSTFTRMLSEGNQSQSQAAPELSHAGLEPGHAPFSNKKLPGGYGY